MKPVVVSLSLMHPPCQVELEKNYDVRRYFSSDDKETLLKQAAPHCQILQTTGGRGAEAALMKQLPNLKLVACFGVGVDAIDLDYCNEHGIAVSNTPEVLSEDVADLALALLLGAIRQVPQADRFVREGQWLKGGMALTHSMQGRRIGIVGMGRIGQAIAKRCAAFNTQIAYTGPRRKADVAYEFFPTASALGQWADVLIAACPGGKATEKIVSRDALKALGSNGVFVNIARGSVVDQDALVELLISGELGGAGLDVFNNEPNVPAKLLQVPHVVLQPHQGSATFDTRSAMGQLTLKNIECFVQQLPLVTPVV
jgi:lactate dehydrogenase-like 2-hydroxyacid dehydrogenase